MKKFTLGFVGWVLIIAFGVVFNYAQEGNAFAAQTQDAAMNAPMGKVVMVDTGKSELTVKEEKGSELVLSVNPDTKISKEGKGITLAEVKTGDRVMFELDGASTPPIAKSLLIMSAKSAKP